VVRDGVTVSQVARFLKAHPAHAVVAERAERPLPSHAPEESDGGGPDVPQLADLASIPT